MNFAPAQYVNILFMWGGIKQTTAPTAAQRWMEGTKVNENFEKIKGRLGEAEKLICENRERPVTPSCEGERGMEGE